GCAAVAWASTSGSCFLSVTVGLMFRALFEIGCNVRMGVMGTLTIRRKGRTAMTTTDWTAWASAATAEYADVTCAHWYCGAPGSGRPRVLLPGGFGSGEMSGPVVPLLA